MRNSIWVTMTVSLFLVACQSTPMTPASVEDKSVNVSAGDYDQSASNGANANGIKEVAIDGNSNVNGMVGNPLTDPSNILSKRNIYFAYNSDAIRADFSPIVSAHARYLQSHSDAKVILQGNTDERGTREYNLSLGQRRSVAVKRALNILGVSDNQIETVSYGEERANVNCASEGCFGQNRRVDIVYQGE